MGLDRLRSKFSVGFANRIVGVTPDLSGEEDAADPSLEKAKVLIIDNIGMLSSIYHYGKMAHIGGGFGSGIHNILECTL